MYIDFYLAYDNNSDIKTKLCSVQSNPRNSLAHYFGGAVQFTLLVQLT